MSRTMRSLRLCRWGDQRFGHAALVAGGDGDVFEDELAAPDAGHVGGAGGGGGGAADDDVGVGGVEGVDVVGGGRGLAGGRGVHDHAAGDPLVVAGADDDVGGEV